MATGGAKGCWIKRVGFKSHGCDNSCFFDKEMHEKWAIR
jgi:hypothetical protein